MRLKDLKKSITEINFLEVVERIKALRRRKKKDEIKPSPKCLQHPDYREVT